MLLSQKQEAIYKNITSIKNFAGYLFNPVVKHTTLQQSQLRGNISKLRLLYITPVSYWLISLMSEPSRIYLLSSYN